MVEASKLKPEVIAQTYDFLHSRPFIEGTGRVSQGQGGRAAGGAEGARRPAGLDRGGTVRASGRGAAERLSAGERRVAMGRSVRAGCAAGIAAGAGRRSRRAAAAQAAETVKMGNIGSANANLWPTHDRRQEGLLCRRGPRRRHRSRAIERGAGAAARGGLARSQHVERHGRHHPRHRQGRAAGADPVRGAVAAVRAGRQARDQGHRRVSRARPSRSAARRTSPASSWSACCNRMGVNPGDYDLVFAGATQARAAALLGGAVDATIVVPPFNFQAEAAGFNRLGLTIDYAADLPFSGTVANRNWASTRRDVLEKLLERAAEEHRLVLRRAEQGGGGRDPGRGESSIKPERHREILRLLPQRPLLRRHRHAVEAQAAARCSRSCTIWAISPTPRTWIVSC